MCFRFIRVRMSMVLRTALVQLEKFEPNASESRSMAVRAMIVVIFD